MNSDSAANPAHSAGRRFRARWRYRRKRCLRWFRRHPILGIVVSLLVAYFIYEMVTRVFVYSRDAYVTTDIIFVAPEVPGPIAKLSVVDDQPVKADEPLFVIDPTLFDLALGRQKAALDVANANLNKARDQLALTVSEIASAQATLVDAQKTRDRVVQLAKSGADPAQLLDAAEKGYLVSLAALTAAQNRKIVALQEEVVQHALIGQAMAAVAQAEFDLQKTTVLAPAAGRVAPLRIRVGQYVAVGKPAVAIVADNRWRVVVNLPERHLPGLAVGQRVWYSISSDPWLVFHAGTVRSIAPGIARSATALEVLPFVEPTTDWVRLPRRFPVEIDLDPTAGPGRLFQGADATIWMVKNPWGK